MNRLTGILLPSIASVFLLSSLFLPWWTASAHLTQEDGSANLSLYSFVFQTPSFRCSAVFFFYSYGTCPLLGSEEGVSKLSFYLFWSLLFLGLSFSLGVVSAISFSRRFFQQLLWISVGALLLSMMSELAFVAGLSTAELKFVTSNVLFGTSGQLSWQASSGFLLSLLSTLLQVLHVNYVFKRLNPQPDNRPLQLSHRFAASGTRLLQKGQNL